MWLPPGSSSLEPTKTAPRDPSHVDPDAVDRGLAGHTNTQNALSDVLIEHRLDPLRPGTEGPQYDLAWECGGTIFVAEVKSTTPSNEEKQLRLGLGQVLRDRSLLAAPGRTVRAVLVAERPVDDSTWMSLCDELEVVLVWPEVFGKKLAEAGALGAT